MTRSVLRSVLFIAVVSLAFAVPAFAQRIVDGAYEPDSIPDVIAYQLFFKSLNPGRNETPDEYKTRVEQYLDAHINLSDRHKELLIRFARRHEGLLAEIGERERREGLAFGSDYQARDRATWAIVEEIRAGTGMVGAEPIKQHLADIKRNTKMRENPNHVHVAR